MDGNSSGTKTSSLCSREEPGLKVEEEEEEENGVEKRWRERRGETEK